MQSVLSTAMARLNSFLDSELESILCFETDIDAEKFCNRKSAIFLVMPEEFNTRYFLISLIVQQLYREILSVADEHGGKLPNRVMMYLEQYTYFKKNGRNCTLEGFAGIVSAEKRTESAANAFGSLINIGVRKP